MPAGKTTVQYYARRGTARLLYIILILMLMPAASCTRDSGTYKETRTIMGTYVTITAERGELPEVLVRKAVADGFAEVERVDRLMSTYKPDSELSRINRQAGMAPVKVDPEVIDTVSLALDVASETGGSFDPTVGPLVKLWGIASKSARVPSGAEIADALTHVGYGEVIVDRAASTVFIKRPGMSIDLGGIAKGYASDRAAGAMKKAGVRGGIVAVAGDLLLFGSHSDGSPWRVGIQHPRDKSATLARLELSDAAISTSGDYERFFMKDGVRYHHILDPRTGKPARGLMSVSVVAPTSVQADSLATGFFVMGPERAMEFALAHPEVDVLMVTSEGKVLATGRFKAMETAPVKPD